MVEYNQDVYNKSKFLTCRFILLDFKSQCYKSNDLEIMVIGREFRELLNYYDNGGRINEDFLLTLKNITLTKSTKILERLIKLIYITSH